MQHARRLSLSPLQIGTGLVVVVGAAIADLDNDALAEIGPIVGPLSLLLATMTVVAISGLRGSAVAAVVWAFLPLTHMVKHVVGLPDTLQPDTYASISHLAAVSLGIAITGGALGMFLRGVFWPDESVAATVADKVPRRDRQRAAAENGLAALADAISRSPGTLLAKGYQASVYLYRTPAGEIVLKKPHAGVVLGGLFRFLLRRECAVYKRLAGVPGVPRCYGLVDGRYLALERINGSSLRLRYGKLENRDEFLAQLLVTLRAMHAAGVAHRDLKRKENIMVGAGDRPYVIDFGIASLRRGPEASRDRVFEHARQLDLNAWIKLKYGRERNRLTPEDAALYKPLWTERLARIVRVSWHAITLRERRQRWRRERELEGGKAIR
ncbi:MAG: phosphotransferase [Gammaproteobacteria bacterium]